MRLPQLSLNLVVVGPPKIISSVVPSFLTLFLKINSLLAMIALSADQSSAQTCIHIAILFIDPSHKAFYDQVRWLIGTPYLLIIARIVNKTPK